MKLLLDTHALIWLAEADRRFSPKARAAIEKPDSEAWFSVASVWEIAIKSSLGKLHVSCSVEDELRPFLEENGIHLLEVHFDHAAGVHSLPFHHRDPFDRLLISQCLKEGFHLISHDAILDAYPVIRIW